MNRYRPTHVLAVLTCLSLVLAACSSGSSPSADTAQSDAATDGGVASGDEIRITASEFLPGELTVAAGTEVVFVNEDSFAHTVTEGTDGEAVDDPIVDEDIPGGGGEVRVTFDEAGTFDITCEIHPAMQMTITVEG